jgi:hypothetical protein
MVASTSFYLFDTLIHVQILSKDHNDEINTSVGESQQVGPLQQDETNRVVSRWFFAVTFGIASLFDLLSSLTEEGENMNVSYAFGAISAYIFFLCAIITIFSKRHVYYNSHYLRSSHEERLCSRTHLLCIFLGDLFFVMGCSVDVIVSVIDNPHHSSTWVRIAVGGFLSSVFWLVDAILYKMADADIFLG